MTTFNPLIGAEQAIEKLLQLSKPTKKEGRRGSADGKFTKGSSKDSKSPQSVTPLLMATKRDDDQHLTTGVVEPHQQVDYCCSCCCLILILFILFCLTHLNFLKVELYADACLAATVLGYIDAAEHFMSLSHR